MEEEEEEKEDEHEDENEEDEKEDDEGLEEEEPRKRRTEVHKAEAPVRKMIHNINGFSFDRLCSLIILDIKPFQSFRNTCGD